MKQWSDYEERVKEMMTWMKDVESSLQNICLKEGLPEKRAQLEKLKNIQGDIREKELEIDALTDKIHQLHKGPSKRRVSQLSELGIHYQILVSLARDTYTKWNQYVIDHQDFINHASEFEKTLTEIKAKLEQCQSPEGTLEDVQEKLAIVQDIVCEKEALSTKFKGITDKAQVVLSSTAPVGHQPINENIQSLQEELSTIMLKSSSVKVSLEDCLHLWTEFLHAMKQVSKVTDYIEVTLEEVKKFQSTLAEKKCQLDKVKSLQHKVQQEKLEVDNLSYRAEEMLERGPACIYTSQAMDIVHRFRAASENINSQVLQNEQSYKNHLSFKSNCDSLVSWMRQLREKIPPLTRSLSDRLNIEATASVLEELLAKKSQGQLKVDSVINSGEIAMASSSENGKKMISTDMENLTSDFQNLFIEIADLKEELDNLCIQLREFKDEYEKVSEWLQVMETDIKSQKTTLKSTIEEKETMVRYCKGLLEELEKGKESVEKLTVLAQGLLTSHLDTYIRNQLTVVNSRFQVILNLAKDVHDKANHNYDLHKQYKGKYDESMQWINALNHKLKEIGKSEGNREDLEKQLEAVQSVMKKQESGLVLVQSAIAASEKVARTSNQGGKDIIASEIHELQSQWDRLLLSISEIKIALETALLQWADFTSSEAKLIQWLEEHDQKLKEVKSMNLPPATKENINQRRARLRKANSIVQDIESFEPMIESVHSKAEQLQQQGISPEIQNKYHILMQEAKGFRDQQKSVMDVIQQFVDSCIEVNKWLSQSREKLSKCAMPSGDRDVLRDKTNKIKILQSELEEGLEKLRQAARYGEIAKANVEDEEEKLMIDDELARLQEEYENLKENVSEIKISLDVGVVKWNEYDEQYSKCSQWLSEMEPLVNSYAKPQADLLSKRARLQEFQDHLQTIFDWQGEFDKLNMKAQLLLETYSDSSISNAFTQLSRKYGALVSFSKEVMHQLEHHFQEHQQQQCMYSECIELIDVSRERLNDCIRPSSSVDEINAKLSSLRVLANSMEQAQNKIRYTMELTEKVIANTASDGTCSIKEDADNLKADFDVLLKDISEAQSSLAERLAVVGEFTKTLRQFRIWLEEIESEIETAGKQELNSLIEKKSVLEKYSTILKELESHDAVAKRLKMDATGHPTVQEEIEECLDKYNNFLTITQTCTSQLTSEIEELENYKAAYSAAETWIRDMKSKLHGIDFQADSKNVIEEKISKFKIIQNSVNEGETLVKKCSELGQTVSNNLGILGKERIAQEIESLSSALDSILLLIKETEFGLKRCLDAWIEYESSKHELDSWLNAFQNKVKPYMESSNEINDTDRLEHLKKLYDELNDHKGDIDALNHICENLVDVSSFTAARDQVVLISGTYFSLSSNLLDIITKLEKYICNQGEFKDARNEFLNWYNQSKAILDENSHLKGDEELLQKRLHTIKGLNAVLLDGQKLLNHALDCGSKVLRVLPDAEKLLVKEEMDEVKQQFSEFSKSVAEISGSLSSVLSRLQEFAQNKNKFMEWLNNVISKLPDKLETKGDIVEIRTKIENFKQIHNDMENHKMQLKELQIEAKELALKTGDDSEITKLDELSNNFKNVHQKCQDLLTQLETELSNLQTYNHALQETEKWLLQMSFHLMSHHSLQISNLVKTKEQSEKHKTLLKEIQDYQKVIDALKLKGNKLISDYKDQVPKLENQIEQQMNNVQESYDSLLMTAENIQAQLEDALLKFKTYEESLLFCEKLLNETKPFISSGLDASKLASQEAKEKLDLSKNILKKLMDGREKLQQAIQGCVEATSSISRPSSPDVGFASSLPEKEMQIKIQLQDYIEQIQAFALSLETIVRDWENISQMKDSIEKWIKEKEQFIVSMEAKRLTFNIEVLNSWLHDLEEIKIQISEKESDIDSMEKKEKQSQVCSSNLTYIREKLKMLDEHVGQLINKCISRKLTIEEMKVLFNEIESQIKASDERIDAIEKQTNTGNNQKKQLLQQSSEDLKVIDMLITKLKNTIDSLRNEFSEESQTDLQNRITSLEKRLEDLRNRCLRKIQSIELLQTNINSLSIELSSIKEWINEKRSQLNTLPKPGYQSTSVESSLQEIRSMQRETLNKEIVIQSSRKKVDALCSDVDQREADSLLTEMGAIKIKFEELCKALDDCIEKLNSHLSKSINFEKQIHDIKQWLTEKEQHLNRTEWFPGKAEDLQNAKSIFAKEETIIKEYEETIISDVYKYADELEEMCNIEDQRFLHATMDDIKRQLIQVKKLLDKKMEELNNMISEQRILDETLEKIRSWLNNTEVILSSDLRLNVSVEVIEEQKKTYFSLLEESKKMFDDIKVIQDAADNVMKKMRGGDKIQLESDLKNIKEKHRRFEDIFRDRLQLLDDAIAQQKAQKFQLEEGIRKLESTKTEMQHLAQPFGPYVTDAESVVERYETILHRVEDIREKLQSIKPIANLVDEFSNLISKYSETLQTLQDRYMKAKQSCLIREQYHSLIKEINETISSCNESVTNVHDQTLTADAKVSKYQEILNDVVECEAKLTIASDKGEQIAKEGSATDCNKIMDELQKLRNKLNELKKTVNNLKTEHENLVASQKKLISDLDNILEKLRDGVSVMQSQPLLTLKSCDVQKEINKHKELASRFEGYLNEASVLCSQVEGELNKGIFPASFLAQIEECTLLQQTLPLAIEEQLQYLKLALSTRKEFDRLKENLEKWLSNAEKLLEDTSPGVDFQNVNFKLLELQKYFSDISFQENQFSEIQKLSSQIRPTLQNDQVPLLDAEIESLKKKLSRIVNLSDKVITETEVDCALWKEYLELINKVSDVLKSPVPEEKPSSIASLNSAIKRVAQQLQEAQKNQILINELNEKVRALNRRASKTSSDGINQQILNINTLWQERLCLIENHLSALTDILNQWEVYSEVDSSIQSSLREFEMRLDTATSLPTDEDTLKRLLSEVKHLGDSIGNLSSLSSGVISYLNTLPNGSDPARQIRDHLQSVQERYQRLLDHVEKKLKSVQEEKEVMKELECEIVEVKKKTHKIEEKIKSLDCYVDDLETVDRTMTEVREEVTTVTETVKSVTTRTKDIFSKKKSSIPESVTKALSSLELLSEATSSALESKERDYKKARAIRLEYTEALDAVVAWLQKAQEQLQDKSNLPEAALEAINVLLSEVPGVKAKLETVRRNGLLIAESTTNESEKQVIQGSIRSLEDQMSKVESWLYEREVQVKEAVNALRQFLESHAVIQAWVQKVDSYLSSDFELVSLEESKQKLFDLQALSKESVQVQQHIKNMGKRLEKIGDVCSAGDLADMHDNIEQDESNADSRLQEQLSLLQEMVEEWEQCERKIKEVAAWVEKAKSTLESPQFKKRSLRDQLTTREKMMSDMSVQKTKVLMALEKLQVHLRSQSSGQHQILTRGQSVQEELEALHSQVEDQCEILQVCVVQEDQYQQDLQTLKHAVSQADHQLKLASSPSVNIEEKEKLMELQQALKDQIQNYNKQISVVQDRIKMIHQTRSPDKDPYKAQIIPLPMSAILPPPPKIYVPPESPIFGEVKQSYRTKEKFVKKSHSPTSTDLKPSYATVASGRVSPVLTFDESNLVEKSVVSTVTKTQSTATAKSSQPSLDESREKSKKHETSLIEEKISSPPNFEKSQQFSSDKKAEKAQKPPESSATVDGTSWASGFLSKPSYADILSGRISPVPTSPTTADYPGNRVVTSSYEKEVLSTEEGESTTEKLESSAFKSCSYSTASSEPVIEMPDSPDISR
ncbi:Nesprin-1, partial [Stegodyphus mimosarum]